MSLEENQEKFKALQLKYSTIKFKPKNELKIFKREKKFCIAEENPNSTVNSWFSSQAGLLQKQGQALGEDTGNEGGRH